MSRKIIPLLSNVLVEQLSKEEVMSSGIVIPDANPDKRRDFKYGLVLGVGDGYNSEALHQASADALYTQALAIIKSLLPAGGIRVETLRRLQDHIPFKKPLPKQVKPGDRVMMNSYALDKIKIQGKDFFLVGKLHVNAIVNEIDCPVCAGMSVEVVDGHEGLCTIHVSDYLKRERSTEAIPKTQT